MRIAIRVGLAGLVSLTFVAAAAGRDGDLMEPIPIEAGGRPIDVEHVGHAAPFVGDVDGDGRKDLLVGEFYKGRLLIYRNAGTDAAPRFERAAIFKDGSPEGCIPAG
jgi:hypothetical protein